MDYVVELGQARCVALVQTKRAESCEENPQTGCWLFQGSLNTDGYGQVRETAAPQLEVRPKLTLWQIFTKKNRDLNRQGRSAQTAFLLHVISYVASNGNHPAGQHISHLCDVRRCFNPDHLVAETNQMNQSRKGCAGPIACSIHHHIIVDLCIHRPRCIRPDRDDVQCCLALKESDPVGWATQRRTETPSIRPSSRAESLERAVSEEFAGAEWLEQAVAQGEV